MMSDINSRDDLKFEIINNKEAKQLRERNESNLGTTHTKQGFETY